MIRRAALFLCLSAAPVAAEPCFDAGGGQFCEAPSLAYMERDEGEDFTWAHFEDGLFSLDITVLRGAARPHAPGAWSRGEISFLEADVSDEATFAAAELHVTEIAATRSDGMNYHFIELTGPEATLIAVAVDFSEEFPDDPQHGKFPEFVATLRTLVTVDGAALSETPSAMEPPQ